MEGSAVERRDRSVLALLELGAAAVLWASFAEPWFVSRGPDYTTWIDAGGLSVAALTTADLLVPFAAFVALVVAVAGLVFPVRSLKVALLTAFGGALLGAILTFQEALYGDSSDWLVRPEPAQGLWLFTATAAGGVALAVVDLLRGGTSTFAWRALNRPSTRRYGPAIAYVLALLITFPVAFFPMDPRWWQYVWLAALAAGPMWWARSRMAR